jgi:hypothetical protein
MPGTEVQELMKSNGLDAERFMSKKMMLFIPVVEGIFYKR